MVEFFCESFVSFCFIELFELLRIKIFGYIIVIIRNLCVVSGIGVILSKALSISVFLSFELFFLELLVVSINKSVFSCIGIVVGKAGCIKSFFYVFIVRIKVGFFCECNRIVVFFDLAFKRLDISFITEAFAVSLSFFYFVKSLGERFVFKLFILFCKLFNIFFYRCVFGICFYVFTVSKFLSICFFIKNFCKLF